MNQSNNCTCDINLTVNDDFNVDLHASDGGGTTNYNLLTNKPSINGVELVGNKTLEDLGIDTEPFYLYLVLNDGTYTLQQVDSYHYQEPILVTPDYLTDLLSTKTILFSDSQRLNSRRFYDLVYKDSRYRLPNQTHTIIFESIDMDTDYPVMRVITLTSNDSDVAYSGTLVEYPLAIEDDLAQVAFSGSYNDLTDKPEESLDIPYVNIWDNWEYTGSNIWVWAGYAGQCDFEAIEQYLDTTGKNRVKFCYNYNDPNSGIDENYYADASVDGDSELIVDSSVVLDGIKISYFSCTFTSNTSVTVRRTDKTIDSDKLFHCVYNETTYADALAAYNAGKVLYATRVRDNQTEYYMLSVKNYYSFSFYRIDYSAYPNRRDNISVAAGGWSYGVGYFEDPTYKVTSLSSSSTDTQYPSAKCVYDAIQALAGIIPEAPSQDGTYTLKATVSNGTKTYSWVAE